LSFSFSKRIVIEISACGEGSNRIDLRIPVWICPELICFSHALSTLFLEYMSLMIVG